MAYTLGISHLIIVQLPAQTPRILPHIDNKHLSTLTYPFPHRFQCIPSRQWLFIDTFFIDCLWINITYKYLMKCFSTVACSFHNLNTRNIRHDPKTRDQLPMTSINRLRKVGVAQLYQVGHVVRIPEKDFRFRSFLLQWLKVLREHLIRHDGFRTSLGLCTACGFLYIHRRQGT